MPGIYQEGREGEGGRKREVIKGQVQWEGEERM